MQRSLNVLTSLENLGGTFSFWNNPENTVFPEDCDYGDVVFSNGFMYIYTRIDKENKWMCISSKNPFDLAVEEGFAGTKQEWLESLIGLDAYQLAVSRGFSGTLDDWLIYITAFGIAKKNGFIGTEVEWLETLTAYGVAVSNGFIGTKDEWLASLKGEKGNTGYSAFEVAKEFGYEGTEQEWLESLKGSTGQDGPKGEKGDTFKISKTYKTFEEMNADIPNEFQDGTLVLISNSASPENGNIYVWNIKETKFDFLLSLLYSAIKGDDGRSAYQIAVDRGFKGTESEWLKSLQGKDGKSAYEVALKYGFIDTEANWLKSLIGKSAYQIAVDKGFKGTENDWLNSLKGKSAYQVAIDEGFKGTALEWFETLKGPKGDIGKSAYQVAVDKGYVGTIDEWILSLKGEIGKTGLQGPKGDRGSPFSIVKTYYTLEEMMNDTTLPPSSMVVVIDELATAARIYWYSGTDFEFLLNLKDTVVQGDPGKDAYDLAIEMGLFSGTEEEWLNSLKGADGKDGRDVFELWKFNQNKPNATVQEFFDYFKGADNSGDHTVFSFNERKTNKIWIDNKPVYRKVINLGQLPNNVNATIPHNIGDIDNIIFYDGIYYKNTNDYWGKLPKVLSVASGTVSGSVVSISQDAINISIDKENIIINLKNQDLSLYHGLLVIECTKITDKPLTQAEIDAFEISRGEPGISAYEVAVKYDNYKGSESEWLESLSGYGTAIKNGFNGSRQDWLESLTAYGVAQSTGFMGNKQEWLDSLNAYNIAVDAGFTGSITEWLDSLSGYGVAVEQGFVGNKQQWLESLNAYGLAKSQGYNGTLKQWLDSLSGYGVAVEQGFVGNKQQWLESLSGYGIALQNGFKGTQTEWLESLTAYGLAKEQGYVGTKEQWLESLNAYGLAKSQGYTGTLIQWLESLNAYGLAKIQGYTGTLDEWLESLTAYGIAKDFGGFTGDKHDWLVFIKKPALPEGGQNGEVLVKALNAPDLAEWQELKVDSRAFQYEQFEASSEWIIKHNCESSDFIVTCSDTSGEVIIGDAEIIDMNTMKMIFTEPLVGKATLIFKSNSALPIPTRKILVDQYAETVKDLGKITAGTIVDIFLSEAPVQLIEPLGNISFRFYDWATPNKSSGVVLSIKMSGSVYSLSYPSNVKWAFGSSPICVANAMNRFSFFSDDGGNTIYATPVGIYY